MIIEQPPTPPPALTRDDAFVTLRAGGMMMNGRPTTTAELCKVAQGKAVFFRAAESEMKYADFAKTVNDLRGCGVRKTVLITEQVIR